MYGLFGNFKLGALIFLTAMACMRVTPEPSLWAGITNIGEILKDPYAWEGKEVKILAYYRWFDLFGEAGTGPPVTRGDVSFADITGAIYAAYWENPGLSPNDTDTLLFLRARVKVNPAGQPYLEVQETKIVEGLPKGVVLRVQLRGGIAGFNQEVLLAKDGSALYLDRNLNHHVRFKVDVKDLEEVLKQIRPFLGQELGTPIPDGFAYTLYAWDGDKVRALTLYAETVPERLEPLLQILKEWFFKKLP